MEAAYKGQDTQIRAVRSLRRAGVDCELVLIGDGHNAPSLQRLAEHEGVEDIVRFAGHLSAADEVRAELDNAHIFLLTSRVEGLSRALVEAMARSMPAVATRVGGNAELLDDSWLIEIGDHKGLMLAIAMLTEDANVYMKAARTNHAVAMRIAGQAMSENLRDFLAHYVG